MKIAIRLLDLLKYRVERFLLGGAHYRFIFIAILIALVSVIGGYIVQMVDPELSVFGRAAWWAFLRLTDPGYLGDDNGIGKRIIATAITILGYVLFMGAFVAIMTQWLHDTMRRLESGYTPISKNGHILILGWSNRSASIIREILSSGGRLKHFLSRLKRGGLHVVILAPEVGPEISIELKEELGEYWNPRNITFRTGIPLRNEDLKRVDFLNASVIILPGKGLYEESVESIDAGTVKTLLSLSNLSAQADQRSIPPVVTEVMDISRFSTAEKAYAGRLAAINSIAIISRLICQILRNPGMSFVYSELLTQEYGCSIYIRNCPELTGKTWQDVARSFKSAVPIGVLKQDNSLQDRVFLCPDLDLTLSRDDAIIFVARSRKETEELVSLNQETLSQIDFPGTDKKASRKLLVLGWSQKVPFLLSQLAEFENESYQINLVSVLGCEEREKILSSRLNKYSNLDLTYTQADYTLPNQLRAIQPDQYDNILFLASDWIHTREDTDARTILGALLLDEVLTKAERMPDVLIELVDPENENLFKQKIGEVIMIPKIISHLIGSVALKMDLNYVFNQLFETSGAEFIFQRATDFNLTGKTFFHEIQNKVLKSGRIPVGLRKATGSKYEIHMGSTHLNPCHIDETDDIVCLVREGD